jgi:threonine synthase
VTAGGSGGGVEAGTAPGGRWAKRLVCSRTGEAAPLDEAAFLSPAGAPYLVEYELDEARGRWLRQRLAERLWGLWRYRELLPMRSPATVVDLGEGGTPLVPLRRLAPPGLDVWMKDESGNPTGSFKARGLSLAVNRARELGAAGIQLPSAGNAALAAAAYAAAAGLPCRVAVPADAPATIVNRCREHGAEVLAGGANLVEAGSRLAPGNKGEDGYWNVATLKEPYRVEGKKTMAYEIAEQLGWQQPDWIIYPTGGGTGIIAMHRAFDELRRLGLVSGPSPRFAAVQMAGCAPIVKAFEEGRDAAEPWPDPVTRAWGLRVPVAVGDFLILRALRESGGAAVAVTEETAEWTEAELARREGMLAVIEGAAALAALAQLAAAGRVAEGSRVVVLQTGHPANYA